MQKFLCGSDDLVHPVLHFDVALNYSRDTLLD